MAVCAASLIASTAYAKDLIPVPVEEQGGIALDGSVVITQGQPVLLFNGKTPPHGYLICLSNPSIGEIVAFSDVGTASADSQTHSILLISPSQAAEGVGNPYPCWRTPSEYRPPGLVSILNVNGSPTAIAARMW
jgi:hypothetical protein